MAGKNAQMASVTLILDGRPQTYELNRPRTIVGREPACEIFISSKNVSRKHCAFIQQNGAILVQDLGSVNGTYVQGRKISECVLQDNDEILVETFLLTYKADPELAASGPTPQIDDLVPELEPIAKKESQRKQIEGTSAKQSARSAAMLWFYSVDEQQLGPVDINTLHQLAKTDVISPDSLVWREGLPDWIPACDVPGLINVRPVAPATLQAWPQPAPELRAQYVPKGGRFPLPMAAPVSMAAANAPAVPGGPLPKMQVPINEPIADMARRQTSALSGLNTNAPLLGMANRPQINSLGTYVFIWGIFSLLGGLALLAQLAHFMLHIESLPPGMPAPDVQLGGFNWLEIVGQGMLAVAIMLCGAFTLSAAVSFRRLGIASEDDNQNIMAAMSNLLKVYKAQVFLGLLVLLAALLLAFFPRLIALP